MNCPDCGVPLGPTLTFHEWVLRYDVAGVPNLVRVHLCMSCAVDRVQSAWMASAVFPEVKP